VIQYVYARYGHNHAAMACTLVTYKARSAIRDVGKALGFPPDILAKASASLDTFDPDDITQSRALRETFQTRILSKQWNQLLDLSSQIGRLPRHLGVHSGGMILTDAPLTDRVPTEPARKKDRYVVQWDKDSLEDAGIVKIDILGLRMLSAAREAVAIIQATTGKILDLDNLTFDDPQVYAF
jgi:error-prone DNA polymerase